MATDDDIVFEDLHGVPKDEPVTIDLDAGKKEDGITITPTDKAAGDDAGKDDDIPLDGLRSADKNVAPTKDDKKNDASTAGEDDDYSKKVKARIQRATRGEKKAKQEATYWEQQARGLAKDKYDREKKASETIIEQADSAIEATQDQLEKAIEDGQTKDQVRLTARLTDLKAEKIQAEYSLDNLPPDGNVQPFSGKVAADATTDQSLADQWRDDRSDWYGAKSFERQTRLANRLDKEVFKDGFDPLTDEYFDELDRRIKEKEPNLFDANDDHGAGDKDRGKKPQSVVTPVGGAENLRKRSSSSKVELTEDDFSNMRRFNLDPNDPEVLKEYARNKREAEAEGATT